MRYSSVVFVVLALAGAACGGSTSHTLLSSAQVPAARGSVKVNQDPNGNTRVRVRVEHLAPANAIQGGDSTYIVWAKPFNGPAQPLGVLTVDKNLTGELETVTPLQTFELIVTPEQSAQVPAPTGAPVLQSEVHR